MNELLRKNSREKDEMNLQRFSNLFEKWSNGSLPSKYFLDEFWLSFDLPDPSQKISAPFYYIHFFPHEFVHDNALKWEIIRNMLSDAGSPVPGEWADRIQRDVSGVPAEIHVSAFGYQDHRVKKSVRLYVVFEHYEEIFIFLSCMKWNGDASALHEQFDSLAKDSNWFALTCDLCPDIQPIIAIELWMQTNRPGCRKQELMQKLVDRGLCTSEKKDAFIEWDREIEIDNQSNIWTWSDPYLEDGNIPNKVSMRMMSRYVKLIFDADRIACAKGYLIFDRPVPNHPHQRST